VAHAEMLEYTITCSAPIQSNLGQPPHLGTTITRQDSSLPLRLWNSCYMNKQGSATLLWTISVKNLTNSVPFDIMATSSLSAMSTGDWSNPAVDPDLHNGLDNSLTTYSRSFPYNSTGNLATAQPVMVLYTGAAQNPPKNPGGFYQAATVSNGPTNFYVTITAKADPLTPWPGP